MDVAISLEQTQPDLRAVVSEDAVAAHCRRLLARGFPGADDMIWSWLIAQPGR